MIYNNIFLSVLINDSIVHLVFTNKLFSINLLSHLIIYLIN